MKKQRRKRHAEWLLLDKKLHDFLKPVFTDDIGRKDFIKKCLKKSATKRMLLRAQWYTEIADGQEKVKRDRPALRLIFLMALAECIAKQRTGNIDLPSFKAIREFFGYISDGDKNILYKGIKPQNRNLRFLSILKILYNVRNMAVHGEDYFSFSLMEKEKKEKCDDGYSLATFGYFGKKGRKEKVLLSIKLTYGELSGIFRKTAIANIKSMLH